MHATPTPIWNEIAKTQQLSTALWRRLFKLKADPLAAALESLETELEAQGADVRTIRGYLLVAPLLQENLAISSWVERTGRTDLRSSLPELTSINEALILASQEYRLSPSQQTKLRQLLMGDYPTARSEPPSAKPIPSR